MQKIIAISGPIAVGKSAIIESLAERFSIHRVSTRSAIVARSPEADTRAALQAAGDVLDEETQGKWVAEEVLKASPPSGAIVVVDAVRKAYQIQALRAEFQDRVVHVHLTAEASILERRYLQRLSPFTEMQVYADAKANSTEAKIEELSASADIVLLCDTGTPASLAAQLAHRLGLEVDPVIGFVDVIVGGQFGSEGKGNVCARIAGEYDVLVRVGGPNAGHKVADPEYTYVQLPSGTGKNPNATVIIGAGSTIWLPKLLREIVDHTGRAGKIIIDRNAMIITQEDRDLEEKLLSKIGSTVQGVGIAAARKIIGRSDQSPIGSKVQLAGSVKELDRYIDDTKTCLERALRSGQRILLEGTQGTGLSLHHGHYPHVTSRETSAAGCISDAGIAPNRVRKIIMVTRTYPIRVAGESGPLPNGISIGELSRRSGLPEREIAKTETGSVSGRARRIAEFDFDEVRRAAFLNGATDIALTFADYISAANRAVSTFDELTEETRAFIRMIEGVTGVRVSMVVTEFSEKTILDRRNWS